MLRTERLLMRRWLEDDLAPHAALCADPEVMRFFPRAMWLDAPGSAEQVTRWEHDIQHRGYGLLALERRTDGAFLGFCGLQPVRDGVPGAGGGEVAWRRGAPGSMRALWHTPPAGSPGR